MIADGSCDSDSLQERLARRGIELIAPHQKNHTRPPTQDSRDLRRHKRRWIVGRARGWFGNYRRLLACYDRPFAIYRAFFHIAHFMIVSRRDLQ